VGRNTWFATFPGQPNPSKICECSAKWVVLVLDDVEIDADGTEDGAGEGWFGRAKRGGKSLGAGAIFLASLALLFWNEGAGKRHSDALAEAQEQVQSATTAAIDLGLEGKLVHLSAQVSGRAGAADPELGVRTTGVALYRQVEMFQWIEFKERTGGRKKRTTYNYEQDWDSAYHDSSQFHQPQGHENPRPTLASTAFFAADAHLGPYRFDNVEVVERALRDFAAPQVPGRLGNWAGLVENLPEPGPALVAGHWYSPQPGIYRRGNQTSGEPALGDLQVSFYALSNDFPLSLLGAQHGDHIETWHASNGDSILLMASGTRSPSEMVHTEMALNSGNTQLLRLAGLLGAVIGGAGMASLLGGVVSMIPIVGRLVNLSLTIAGALLGLVAGLLTIMVAWLTARPWVAALILVAIGAAVTWAWRKRGARGSGASADQSRKLAASARERIAALGQAVAASPALRAASAGPSGTPPPPPPAAPGRGSTTPTRRVLPVAPPPPPPGEETKELPPLEWNPVSAAAVAPTPAAVGKPPSPGKGSSAPTKRVPIVVAPPAPAEESKELPPLEWTPGLIATKPAAVVVPVAASTRVATTAPPPGSAAKASPPQPAAAAPLFDTVPVREAGTPGFDTVPMRETGAPALESLLTDARGAPLFESVSLRDTAAPLFDDLPLPKAAAAIDPPKNQRIALGSTGEYQLNKIVRQHADGLHEVLCFELMQAGKPIKRGTQEEVKEALRLALKRN
jgi:hypothetical protein